jgi:hypothetical protein
MARSGVSVHVYRDQAPKAIRRVRAKDDLTLAGDEDGLEVLAALNDLREQFEGVAPEESVIVDVGVVQKLVNLAIKALARS